MAKRQGLRSWLSTEAPGRTSLTAFIAVFWTAVAWSAVHPFNPSDYFIEIATPVCGFIVIAAVWRWFRFTTLSTMLLLLEGLVLIVGAHYTHERVPLFDWLRDACGFERNHYDRFAHFLVGFLCVIPVREVLARATPLREGWLLALSAISMLGFAAFYEITEWWIAVITSPETGAAYLGAQGDPWDAQKDMLLDGLGAISGLLLLTRLAR